MAGPINLDVVRRKHDQALAYLRSESAKALSDAGRFAVDYAINKSNEFRPNPLSPTRRATRYMIRISKGKLTLHVSNPTLVGRVLESGSVPHKIKAKKGKALKFKTAQGTMFRREVQHPGTQPTYWFTHLEHQTRLFMDRRMRLLHTQSSRRFNRAA